MQLNVGASLLLSLLTASASFAAPQAAPSNISSREADVDGHVFICTDANFSGDCVNYGFFNNQCSNLPPAFQDDISSAGPDQGWICTFWVDENCPSPGARADSIAYPGVTNFAPDGFNDSFKSVKCIRE